MTTFDKHKNFAISTVVTAPGPPLTGLTLAVASGEGALFPAAPFNAVVFPANAAPAVANGEIVRVTSKGAGDNWTILRTQESTAARSIQVGDRIANSITVKALTDIEQAVNSALGFVALAAAPVLETGIAGQARAGRVLTVADFTTLLGLSTPVGLFGLGDLSNLGSGGALVNKGAVAFGSGITGAATEAAIFTGSTGQALYIVDTGAADPFRVSYGSWGCWFRTAKSSAQNLVTKLNAAASSRGFQLTTSGLAGGVVAEIAIATVAGGAGAWAADLVGTTFLNDDRYHHIGATYDGTVLSLYVDGVLEAQTIVASGGPLNGSTGPLNIGAWGADGATAASGTSFARTDEAFVTGDVLSAEQMRLLYAAKVAHSLGAVPLSAKVAVRRRRRGAPLTTAMFSATPLHLYNFPPGASQFADQGSLGVALVQGGGGGITAPGADGSTLNDGSIAFAGTGYYAATDTGLPSGTNARSMGLWFKALTGGSNQVLLFYGTIAGNAQYLLYLDTAGKLSAGDNSAGAITSAFSYGDGLWHHVVMTYDGAAVDGLRQKLYVDGKLVGTSTSVLTATTLAGATAFRIGAYGDGSALLKGNADSVFVSNYAAGGDEIANLYAAGAQSLGISPKNAGDHVEAMDAASIYLIADPASGVFSQDLLDLEVAS